MVGQSSIADSQNPKRVGNFYLNWVLMSEKNASEISAPSVISRMFLAVRSTGADTSTPPKGAKNISTPISRAIRSHIDQRLKKIRPE